MYFHFYFSFSLSACFRVSTESMPNLLSLWHTYSSRRASLRIQETKSTGSETVTVKLSHELSTNLLSRLMLMNFYARFTRWYTVVVARWNEVRRLKGQGKGGKRAWLMKVRQHAKAGELHQEHRLRELQRWIYGAFLASCSITRFARDRTLQIRLVNNILRVCDICKDSTAESGFGEKRYI